MVAPGCKLICTLFFARDVYGISVMTACVAGNSYGIHAAHSLPTDFIDQEFKDIADDFKVGACKTGMLADSELIRNVVKNYNQYDFGPMVVDPVIMTKHGNMLLEEAAFETMRTELIPLATVLTPNFYETQKLAEMPLKSDDDLVKAAHKLQDLGAKNVIAKGYHQDENQREVRDYVLLESGDGFWLTEPITILIASMVPAIHSQPALRLNWRRARPLKKPSEQRNGL